MKPRGDVYLAKENAKAGYDEVHKYVAKLAGKWTPERISALGNVVADYLAAMYADSQASLAGAPSGAVRADINAGSHLYTMMFSALDTCALFGVIPAEDVSRLRAGRGAAHIGQALVNVASYWDENDGTLAGNSPVQSSHRSQCVELGNKLVMEIKPKLAHARTDPAIEAADDRANRYWTLLVDDHEEVEKAAFEIWGNHYRDHVPPLQSRVVHKAKAEPAPQDPPPAQDQKQTTSDAKAEQAPGSETESKPTSETKK